MLTSFDYKIWIAFGLCNIRGIRNPIVNIMMSDMMLKIENLSLSTIYKLNFFENICSLFNFIILDFTPFKTSITNMQLFQVCNLVQFMM